MPENKMFDNQYIETYVMGRLPDPQGAMLREAFRQDPDLLFEYRWQRDLIQCLQHYRRRELKHRLQMTG